MSKMTDNNAGLTVDQVDPEIGVEPPVHAVDIIMTINVLLTLDATACIAVNLIDRRASGLTLMLKFEILVMLRDLPEPNRLVMSESMLMHHQMGKLVNAIVDFGLIQMHKPANHVTILEQIEQLQFEIHVLMLTLL